MRALNDLYLAMYTAICILLRGIICNRDHAVDMGHKYFPPSPIRRSTQDPEWRSEISYPGGIGYLNKRPIPPPELKIRKQEMRKYKPAYQGV